MMMFGYQILAINLFMLMQKLFNLAGFIFISPIFTQISIIINSIQFLKMKQRHWIQIRIARTIGRSILKTQMHNIVYFILLTISCIHTVLSFAGQQSNVYMLLKWFDPSFYLEPHIIVYAMIGPCLTAAGFILLQFVWGMKENSIQTTITKHYIIKISCTLAVILAYLVCLPLVRCSVIAIGSQNIIVQVLGAITLVVYLVIIYPFSMFLLTDLSPQNNNVYAVVDFPNVFFVLNIYRPVAAIMVAAHHSTYVIIPTAFLFLFITLSLFKLPTITWKFNKLSQALVSAIIWTIICRFAELSTQQKLLLPIYLIGLPIFVLFMIWLLKARVVRILKRKTNSVLKLKIIFYFLASTDKQCDQLYIFIMHHYRICPLQVCSCHKIVGQFQLQKATNEQNKKMLTLRSKSYKKTASQLKSKLIKTFNLTKTGKTQKMGQQNIEDSIDQQKSQNVLKSKERQSWFQLLYEMQNEQFLIDKLRQLPVTERQLKLRKAKQIILDQAEILHYYLDRQYQSLRNLWFVDDELAKNNLVSFFFLIRFCIEEQKQEETIKLKSRQEGSNQYALKYYELQTKLMFFRELLLKAVLKSEQFWAQLNGKKPDQYKLTLFIKQFLSSQKNISKELKKYLVDKSKSNANNDYEQSWDMKIKAIIQNTYVPYEFAMKLTKNPKMNNEVNIQIKQVDSKILQKNLLFYDCNAKTGMGIVNVQQGDEFGLVTVTNKQFWQLLNCPRYDKARINHFLVKQMHEYHDKTIVNFLKKNKYFLNFHRGFIVDGTKHLVQIQFSVELLPHVYDGLFGAAFLQQIKSSKSIFLTNRSSNILAYNMKFEQTFLDKRNLIQFDEIISKQVMVKLEEEKKCKVWIENDQYLVERCHVIYIQDNQSQNLYFCQISQQWDEIPHKTKVIEDEIKEDFYVRNQQERLSRISALPVALNQKTKQKKEELQSLMSIARSEKVSKKISKWKIFIIVSLVSICLLAIVCCLLSELKQSKYQEANQTYNSLTNLIQDITQIAYSARKINLIQFSKSQQSILPYYQEMGQLESRITQQKKNLNTGLWAESYTSYQVTSNGKIIASKTTYDMMIQKYLLAAYTTFLNNINEQNFDYARSQVQIPFSSSYINFLTFLYNNYYTVLPITITSFRDYIVQRCYTLIGFMSSAPIIIMNVLIILVCVAIQIITIWMRLKIKKALWLSLKLLEKLNMNYIQERIQTLKIYKEGCLSDLYETKREKIQIKQQQKQQKQPLNKRVQAGNQSILMKISQYSKQLSMQFEDSTARDFQNTNRQKLNKQPRIKEKNKFRMKDISKLKTVLIILSSILPIIALGISILGVQISFNSRIQSSLQLKQLYSKKIEGIKMIKSYCFQLGYETNDNIVSNLQISEQLPNLFQSTYEVLRGIKNMETAQKVQYRQAIKPQNSSAFCDVLSSIKSAGYQIQLCNSEEVVTYGNKSQSQIMVDYIETARSVYEQYKHLSISVSQQRAFSTDPRHDKFERGSLHLGDSEQYIMIRFDQIFANSLQKYQATIIVLSIAIVLIVVLIKQFWVPYQIKLMEFEMDQIKTILLLISQSEINQNSELKSEIMSNYSLFAVLK